MDLTRKTTSGDLAVDGSPAQVDYGGHLVNVQKRLALAKIFGYTVQDVGLSASCCAHSMTFGCARVKTALVVYPWRELIK